MLAEGIDGIKEIDMKFTNYVLFSHELQQRGLGYALDHTSKLGFEAVEWLDSALDESSIIPDMDAARATKNELNARNLTVSCYSVLVDLLGENVDKMMDRVYRHIEYAAEFGSPYVHHTLIPAYKFKPGIPTYEDALLRVADNAERIAKRCNEYGIICLYEPQGIYFNGVPGLKALLSEMKSRGCNVGLCGDTGNSVLVDTPPVEIFKNFAEDIKHIHVKDYKYVPKCDGKNYFTTSGKYVADAGLGEGISEVVKCFDCVKDYSGNISFEMRCDDAQMLKNIEYVKNILNITK